MKSKVMHIAIFMLSSCLFGAPVTFRVDMSFQAELGRFNPDSDMPDVAGDFNGWTGDENWVLTDIDSDLMYEGTFDIPVGIHSYVFRNNGTWDNSWEPYYIDVNDGNRSIDVPEAGLDLEVVWYANLEPAPYFNTEVVFTVNFSYTEELDTEFIVTIPFNNPPVLQLSVDGEEGTDFVDTLSILVENLVVGGDFVTYRMDENIFQSSGRVYTTGMEQDTDMDGFVECYADTIYMIADVSELPAPVVSGISDTAEVVLNISYPDSGNAVA